jgi:Bacterial Ig-like domain (group 3)
MERKKPKSPRVGRFGRAAVLLGVATATAGAMVLGAGAAHAAVGKDPGAVTLSPASGSVNSSPTWSTSQACATGFQGSAVFRIEESNGTTFSISGTIASVTAPFSGTLLDPISTIATSLPPGIPDGGTAELVVYCFSGASLTGTSDPEMSTFLTISADGTTYSTSASPPAGTATTTTLTASPNPATTGQTVTLTANTSAADGTNPAGSVQFESGSTAIGSAVAVSAGGVATTTTTFAAAGTESLSAVFTPTSNSYESSTGTYSETVNVATTSTTGSEPLAVTVPATGSFTLTVATGTVNLSVSGATATGALNPITVSDTRNTFPGWSVSGQTSDFTGSGSAAGGDISGNQLGWVPTDTSLATGATLGGTVTPAGPGLGSTAAVLASAAPGGGGGTSALGANLTLDIPASAIAGPYAATLTVTAVTTGP